MTETRNNPPGPFQPYVRNINMDDPLMKRVPFDRMGIAANSTSMPSGMSQGPGKIEHVGGSVKSR